MLGVRVISEDVLAEGQGAAERLDIGHREADPTDVLVQHEELVRKVEELEEKKSKLDKEQHDEVIRFAAAQRALVDRFDEFKMHKLIRDSANMNKKHTLQTK